MQPPPHGTVATSEEVRQLDLGQVACLRVLPSFAPPDLPPDRVRFLREYERAEEARETGEDEERAGREVRGDLRENVGKASASATEHEEGQTRTIMRISTGKREILSVVSFFASASSSSSESARVAGFRQQRTTSPAVSSPQD